MLQVKGVKGIWCCWLRHAKLLSGTPFANQPLWTKTFILHSVARWKQLTNWNHFRGLNGGTKVTKVWMPWSIRAWSTGSDDLIVSDLGKPFLWIASKRWLDCSVPVVDNMLTTDFQNVWRERIQWDTLKSQKKFRQSLGSQVEKLEWLRLGLGWLGWGNCLLPRKKALSLLRAKGSGGSGASGSTAEGPSTQTSSLYSKTVWDHERPDCLSRRCHCHWRGRSAAGVEALVDVEVVERSLLSLVWDVHPHVHQRTVSQCYCRYRCVAFCVAWVGVLCAAVATWEVSHLSSRPPLSTGSSAQPLDLAKLKHGTGPGYAAVHQDPGQYGRREPWHWMKQFETIKEVFCGDMSFHLKVTLR